MMDRILLGARGFVALATTLLVTACTSSSGQELATISDEASESGYVNAATAEYAACLTEKGMEVSPRTEGERLLGYAEIKDATFLPGADGANSDDSAQIIGVGGENRDSDIRSCYRDHSGAKDVLIDMGEASDNMTEAQEQVVSDGELEAGKKWASCARDAGMTFIEDPDVAGYVKLFDPLTVEQAEVLGEECSRPMADDEFWPLFQFYVTVDDPELGTTSDPFAAAINGPFLESDKMKEEGDPDEFVE